MPEEKHIFDLSRCPNPLSDAFIQMDEESFYECDKYEKYTERATAVSRGQKINSDFPCNRITQKGNYCDGTVQLQRLDIPKEIQWKCQKCGDHGAIINFEGTHADLSDLSPKVKKQYLNQDFDYLFDFEKFDDDSSSNAFTLLLNRLDPTLFEEMMGIATEKFEQLFTSNWKEPGAPLHIRDDRTFAEVNQSLFFYNARSFLQLLAEQGSFKTTQAGNLKRKTVDELMKTCRWPDGYLNKIHNVNKVINEKDAWLLHMIRVLMDLAGLIREEQGSFLPVLKRLHLIEKKHAGELFQLLFLTYFVKMNMGYRTGSRGGEYLQDGLPYSFYRLHKYANKWASSETLFELILLPGIKMQLANVFDMPDYNPGLSTTVHSLLRPLVHFGMLEERQTGEKRPNSLIQVSEFRKTSLFDNVIAFNIQ